MRRISAVLLEILVHSPTRSEFTCIVISACDRNQLAYCSPHNFAQESLIDKIKVPFWSAINVLSGGVLISVSIKCGEWVVYPERVAYTCIICQICHDVCGFDVMAAKPYRFVP